MAAVNFEFRFDTDGEVSQEDVEKTKQLFMEWVAKKYFQASFNGGFQNATNLNIQVLSYTEDDADFEVVDGWAEPVNRYSIIKK